jgi:transcription antitermination protein NusB
MGAVQALYQMEISGIGDEAVVAEFTEHRFGRARDGSPAAEPDLAHFERVVRGVISRQTDVDHAINGSLKSGWTLERIDATARAILRAGTYEVLACDDVPPRVILNEYVEIAHAFFSGDEPGFINGVLDHIARRERDLKTA